MHETTFHTHDARRLYKPDLPAFQAHLIRLDPETRYNRFGLQVSDDYLRNYSELCFKPGSIVYGHFEDGIIRGAAELRVFEIKDNLLQKRAEAAFSVETEWRLRGIGTELMGHVVLAARNRRVVELTIFCLRHNQAMLRLAKKFEADLVFERNDVTGHLVARPPNPMSYFREMVESTLDIGNAVMGRLYKSETVQPG